MTDWRKEVYHDNVWLHHWDIEDVSPITVQIEGYDRAEAFNPGTKEKGSLWALKFKGATKILGINVTNGELIEQWLGSDKDKWVGKKIMLRVAMCKGEKCIRVAAKEGARLPAKCPKFEYIDKVKPKKKAAEPTEPPETPPDDDLVSDRDEEELPIGE